MKHDQRVTELASRKSIPSVLRVWFIDLNI